MLTSIERAARWPRGELALAGLLLAALAFAYLDALRALEAVWDGSPMYSYGYLVPFVSAYLLWSRRVALAALTPQPAHVFGTVTLLGSALLLFVGRAGGVNVLQQLGFFFAVVAAALLVFGPAYVRTGWAAIAYLLLMIPVWDGLTEPLHTPFQLLSARIGVSVLQAVGIPAYQEGTLISLPNLTLEVARACSGVNYLVAVLALGLPLGYLYLSSVARRVLLIASAILVAALSNGLRVSLIGVLAYLNVGSPLHGPFHVLHGLFVSAAGYVVLFIGLKVLMNRERATPERVVDAPAPVLAERQSIRVPRMQWAFVTLVFLLLGSGFIRYEPRPVPFVSDLHAIPANLDSWRAEAVGDSAYSNRWPNADVELRRRYRRNSQPPVDLYIAYFEAQRDDRAVAGYRTADLHHRTEVLTIPGQHTLPFEANLVRDPAGRAHLLFWYDISGQVVTGFVQAKLQTLWNASLHSRSNGAAVVLAVKEPNDASVDDLQDLAGRVRAALARRATDPMTTTSSSATTPSRYRP